MFTSKQEVLTYIENSNNFHSLGDALEDSNKSKRHKVFNINVTFVNDVNELKDTTVTFYQIMKNNVEQDEFYFMEGKRPEDVTLVDKNSSS